MITVLTVNIGAAAADRAERLAAWLADRDDDAILLTETSNGPGTALILNRYRRAGWRVIAQPDPAGDRGAALLTRLAPSETPVPRLEANLPHRLALCGVATDPPAILASVYVPSRDASAVKVDKKRQFLASLLSSINALATEDRARLLLGGDYNVLARDHQPRYQGFLDFEYAVLESLGDMRLADTAALDERDHSWIGRTGSGYRYDYVHAGAALIKAKERCRYLHETRELQLTDHAALEVTFNVDAKRLDVTSLEEPEAPTLF
ncbi:hypothetical protein GCM10027447_27830 [Glycomyces halotolerans]